MNNEVYFNELSLKNRPNDIAVRDHLKECWIFLSANKINYCRARHEDITDLLSYITSIDGVSKKTSNDFIRSFFRSPFEKDEDEKEIDSYLLKNLYYNDELVDGLHWAQVYDTLSLSLLTEDQWGTSSISLRDDEDNLYDVRNISTTENAFQHKEWIDGLKDIVLISTDKSPEEKRFHVSSDHGEDKLREYWYRIRNCDYVDSCVNSLPFNNKETDLIRNIFSNGTIEIVLHWEDAGYGMVIQTTGRNIRETKKIAEIIRDRYDR